MTEKDVTRVREQVADLLARYGDHWDPEQSHVDEDKLLETIIRELASTSELAAALLPLLDADRTRWYA